MYRGQYGSQYGNKNLDGMSLEFSGFGWLKMGGASLVPRLPRSGTGTLKLCRRGEPRIFCHVKSAKGRKEVEELDCAWPYRDSEQEKEQR